MFDGDHGDPGVGRDKRQPLTALADVFDGSGGDYHTTYFPQPTFISSRRYYGHVVGYNYMELDFSHENFHEIFILGKPHGMYFNVGSTMVDTLRRLTYFLRRQPELPDWLHDGVILGVQGGTQRVSC